MQLHYNQDQLVLFHWLQLKHKQLDVILAILQLLLQIHKDLHLVLWLLLLEVQLLLLHII